MSHEYIASMSRGDQSSRPLRHDSRTLEISDDACCDRRPRVSRSASSFTATCSTKNARPCIGSAHSGPLCVASWNPCSIASHSSRSIRGSSDASLSAADASSTSPSRPTRCCTLPSASHPAHVPPAQLAACIHQHIRPDILWPKGHQLLSNVRPLGARLCQQPRQLAPKEAHWNAPRTLVLVLLRRTLAVGIVLVIRARARAPQHAWQ